MKLILLSIDSSFVLWLIVGGITPLLIESIEENNISTSKFNFKNEEAKPTIQNFSSHSTKKEEILKSENDEIKIEIESNKKEEILDEDEIAKGLVKKFGEYDHTLELKNFKPPKLSFQLHLEKPLAMKLWLLI